MAIKNKNPEEEAEFEFETSDLPANESRGGLKKGLIFGLTGAVIVAAIVAAVVFFSPLKDKIFPVKNTNTNTNTNAAVTADAPKLRLTIINDKSCSDCFDTNLLIDALKKIGINEVGRDTLDAGDSAAKQLIEKYKITKAPTILIAGELDKNEQLKAAWPNLGEIVDNVFVLRQVLPPYTDLATGNVKGRVSVTFLTAAACKECYDVNLHKTALAGFGVSTNNIKTVDMASDEGKELVAKYKIAKAPTVIISGDAAEYQSLTQIWQTVGTVASDGAYIFTDMNQMGNYWDLKTKKMVKVELQTAAAPAGAVAGDSTTGAATVPAGSTAGTNGAAE